MSAGGLMEQVLRFGQFLDFVAVATNPEGGALVPYSSNSTISTAAYSDWDAGHSHLR